MNFRTIFKLIFGICHFGYCCGFPTFNFDSEKHYLCKLVGIDEKTCTHSEKVLLHHALETRRREEKALQDVRKLENEKGNLETQKNKTEQDAAKLEFLLIYRNKLVYIENNYCPWMPTSDWDYIYNIQRARGFQNFQRSDLAWNKHSKTWLWILIFGDANKCAQLDTLRAYLNYDPQRYIWFANQAQKMFELLSDDNHLEGRVLDVNYLKKDQIETYITFLNPDMREAARIFFKSEGLLISTKTPLSSTLSTTR